MPSQGRRSSQELWNLLQYLDKMSSKLPESCRVCSKTWMPSLKMKIYLNILKVRICPKHSEIWISSPKIRIKICPGPIEFGCTKFIQKILWLGQYLSRQKINNPKPCKRSNIQSPSKTMMISKLNILFNPCTKNNKLLGIVEARVDSSGIGF